MKRNLLSMFLLLAVFATEAQQPVSMSTTELRNKIKGGWAGQTIGVTFGGPYEFRFQGTFIGDYQPLIWYDGYLKKTMLNIPGLYDDLYMDLTFVDVMKNMAWMLRLILLPMRLPMPAICYGMPTRPAAIIF